MALEEAGGDYYPSSNFDLKILSDLGLITKKQKEQLSDHKNSEALLSDNIFMNFCGMLEYVNVELTRVKYQSLQKGSIAKTEESFLDLLQPSNSKTNSTQLPYNPTTEQKTVNQMVDFFFESKKGKISDPSMSQYKVPTKLLLEYFKPETLISEVTRERCRKLMALLSKIPKYASVHYQGASLLDTVEVFRKNNGEYANRIDEMRKHLPTFNSIFELAVEEGWIAKSPWKGLQKHYPNSLNSIFDIRYSIFDIRYSIFDIRYSILKKVVANLFPQAT